MRLGAFILLVPITTAFPSISSAQIWLSSFRHTTKNFIDNPLRRSTIPQFILDTQHPWIVTNKRRLEQLPNSGVFLCSLPNMAPNESNEEETLEALEIPPDLFYDLRIDGGGPSSPPGWPNPLDKLEEINTCQRALKEVKALEVDIYIYRGSYADLQMKILEPSQPSERLLTLFGDALESMTNLETLKWNIPKEDTHFFEESFKLRKLYLPSVEHLEPGPSSQYLVEMCPNLVELQNGGGHMWHHGDMPDNRNWGLMLVQAAASVPKLKRFAMEGGHRGWTPELLFEVIKSMPQIESLGLLGSLGQNPVYGAPNMGDSGRLKDTLDMLSGLANLTHLDLPSSSDLGLGFDGGPGCGNFYDGKEGQLYLREVIREGAEATELGGDIVVANLPHLTSFTIGGQSPCVDGGIGNLTWPWTGRMDEWLRAEVPIDDSTE
ncbi:hypothetical protein CJF31_00009094 [Rutstroemia sp. NJR-2017a BVV2]|nr:hypothetical protein CJF31_00009094 [Rutstroemia sp. NJR-2017a BVV2]